MKLSKYLPIFVLLLIYLGLRLIFLWQIPLFEDEALFTGWSLDIIKSLKTFTKPLSSGISPLFSWMTAFFMIFIPNQFAAGRMVSVASGLILMLVLYLIFSKLINKNYAFLLSLTYIFLPIMFVYNRLALLDTLMILFIFLSVYFSLLFLKTGKIIFLIGYLFFQTLSLLTKPISLITIAAILCASLIFRKEHKKEILNFFIASLISLGIYFVIFLPFRLQTSSILSDYVFLPENFNQLIMQFKKNSWLTLHWLVAYYPISVLLGGVLGFFLALIKNHKENKYYAIIFAIYFFSIIISDKLYFPRHTLIFAPFIIIFCAILILYISKISKSIVFVLFFFFLIQNVLSIRSIVLNPEKNRTMAKEDKFQFYQDWTSGKILPEIAKYFDSQASNFDKIVIWTDNNSLYYYGLPVYLKSVDKMNIYQLPQKKEDFNLIPDKNIKQFLIVNKGLNYDVSSIERIQFEVSERHKVEILKLN